MMDQQFDDEFVFCADVSSSESECDSDGGGSSCSSSSDSDVFDVIAEIKRKKDHPDRLHEELWYNDPGQVCLTFTSLLRNHFSEIIVVLRKKPF